jgi:hypothetical protein
MKLLLFFILFFLSSCGYPDIDSVPNFKNIKLTNDELIDLCQLPSADKSRVVDSFEISGRMRQIVMIACFKEKKKYK